MFSLKKCLQSNNMIIRLELVGYDPNSFLKYFPLLVHTQRWCCNHDYSIKIHVEKKPLFSRSFSLKGIYFMQTVLFLVFALFCTPKEGGLIKISSKSVSSKQEFRNDRSSNVSKLPLSATISIYYALLCGFVVSIATFKSN